MALSMTIDTSRLDQALGSLHDAAVGKGQDLKKLLIGQQKLLAQSIVKLTAPKDKKQGEMAIERDLHKIITEVDSKLFNEIGSEYGTKNIDAYRIIKKEKINLRWDNLVVNAADLPALHMQYRDSRGRPTNVPRSGRRTWGAAIVVERGVQAAYIRKVQERVGRWKAKWAYAAHKMGASFPGWISRHFESVASKSHAMWDLDNPNGPSVVFGGIGPNFGKDIGLIRAAVKIRARAVARLTKLILSDYSKDLAKGMRAQSHARKYAEAES